MGYFHWLGRNSASCILTWNFEAGLKVDFLMRIFNKRVRSYRIWYMAADSKELTRKMMLFAKFTADAHLFFSSPIWDSLRRGSSDLLMGKPLVNGCLACVYFAGQSLAPKQLRERKYGVIFTHMSKTRRRQQKHLHKYPEFLWWGGIERGHTCQSSMGAGI